ncbi:MAG: stage IV sporulation protein A [Lachnospiraceae bacterium]
MEKMNEDHEFNLYKDIQQRTNGEIYIGVVGPVRTGKSTFIKRFMDLLVLPVMKDEYEIARTRDELPQSAGGRTITTTEPKFIPKEAVNISLNGNVDVKVRMIDCVGYMVEGAAGHLEEDSERMVKTPWYNYEIPFTQAAEIGTRKVINDHSTIGIVIVTDGSFGEIPKENYVAAEEKTIMELKRIGKPFIVLVNSARPYSEEAQRAAKEMEETYQVNAQTVNCEQLKKEDIFRILSNMLYEFPVSVMEFYMPKWVELLANDHPVKLDIVERVKDLLNGVYTMRDVIDSDMQADSSYIKQCKVDRTDLATGIVQVQFSIDDAFYYELISELVGESVDNDYCLMRILQELSSMKKEYVKVLNALDSVRFKGYGVVTPERCEISLQEPEIIRHGNKFGVKIKAESPSIHLIKALIETEIAPIVGTQEQAEDLITYIKENSAADNSIWDTNIFGKSIEQLVQDGIKSKITMINDESQVKLQETMQKIVNDSTGGLICIII